MTLELILDMNDDEVFTLQFSKYLNVFLHDLAETPQKVLDKVIDFSGDRDIVRKAINEGPDTFEKTDTEACKTLMNFIEFYNTGSFTKLEVEVIDDTVE